MWLRRLVLLLGFTILLSIGGLVITNLQKSTTTPERPTVTNLTYPHLTFTSTARAGVPPVVCIQGVGIDAATELEAAHRIQDMMLRVKEDPVWLFAYGSDNAGNLILGCPPPANFDGEGNYFAQERVYAGTATPVPYDIFLYVYPDDRLAMKPERITSEQSECGGDVCFQQGYGLYLTPVDICDDELLFQSLRATFGLIQPREPYPRFAGPESATPYFDVPASWLTSTPTPTPRPVCF